MGLYEPSSFQSVSHSYQGVLGNGGKSLRAMIHNPLETNVIINHLKTKGTTEVQQLMEDPHSLHFDLELHETQSNSAN